MSSPPDAADHEEDGAAHRDAGGGSEPRTATPSLCRVCQEPLRLTGAQQDEEPTVHEACRAELRCGVSLY